MCKNNHRHRHDNNALKGRRLTLTDQMLSNIIKMISLPTPHVTHYNYDWYKKHLKLTTLNMIIMKDDEVIHYMNDHSQHNYESHYDHQ